MQKRSHWMKLVISIFIAQSAGLIGAFFTTPNIDTWYRGLTKPSLTPPDWVFGPAWTLLYTLMGISLFLAWTHRVGEKARILWIRMFLIHLLINTAWSIVFFGKEMVFAALIIIGVLWFCILGLMLYATRFDKRITYLLTPYLAWVSYATYLNYSILKLNE